MQQHRWPTGCRMRWQDAVDGGAERCRESGMDTLQMGFGDPLLLTADDYQTLGQQFRLEPVTGGPAVPNGGSMAEYLPSN